MPDLLLELFSEEIPARMQAEAALHLEKNMRASLGAAETEIFSTPRRIALRARNLPVEQPAIETELKGPKIGAPESALQGFLKKNNLTPGDLVERDGAYFATVRKEGRKTAELLKEAVEATLCAFPWPKSMRWGAGEQRWVRPLHAILCLFDGNVVPVEFAGIKAGDVTYGHRFLSPEAIKITRAAEYETLLEKSHVIACREKRREMIAARIGALAAARGLAVRKDDGLLEEVTGLVEWPVALMGSIDARFMDLPREVLISEMRAHQKYFALETSDGRLADTFIAVANIETKDEGKAIIAGNERVLRARLSDGRFFWDQDRKKTLDEWAKGLADVTFHAKLGSVADKVTRITALAERLAPYCHPAFIAGSSRNEMGIPQQVRDDIKRAGTLCKADLVTGMVGEFPELQGVMGRYYALYQKESPEVADAIRDHYLPLGPASEAPRKPVSVCIALADKLDTLVSMFAIGEKPTGSKDPFALRRAALGVIRIVLENNLRLPLKQCFAAPPAKDIALRKAHDKLVRKTEAALHDEPGAHKIGKYLTLNETAYEDLETAVPPNLSDMLYEFFIDRLKVQLKDQGIRHDVIAAAVAGGDDDLVRVVERARAVQAFLDTEDGRNLLAAYKRAASILAIEEKKDKRAYDQPADVSVMTLPEEKTLLANLTRTAEIIKPLLDREDFTGAMAVLSQLRAPVDGFFDKVMVNDKDRKTRENRLNLLACLHRAMDGLAQFARIEG